jgi:hypothetical protein
MIMVGLILVFWGCGHGQKADTKMQSEGIDEVTRIHNLASPLHPEKTVVLEEDLSIGGEDADSRRMVVWLFRIFKRGGPAYSTAKGSFCRISSGETCFPVST